MEPGDRLYTRVEKIAHNDTYTLEEKLTRMRTLFADNLPSFPRELIDDLFDGLLTGEVTTDEELLERSEYLPSLIELLVGEFDDRRDPFNTSQWHLIGEIISEFGLELEEKTLAYIMSKVVERKAI
jgi:hypothetical protein